jgi:hypothetical protein
MDACREENEIGYFYFFGRKICDALFDAKTKCICFKQCDGIRNFSGDIFIDVTSSLENASLRGGCIIKT